MSTSETNNIALRSEPDTNVLQPCFSIETQRDFQIYLTNPNNKSQAWFTTEERDIYRNWLMFPEVELEGEKGVYFD